ncbi:hypothetical protein H4S14_000452 [Agrobacterium vitis]|nr:hypothetical protein [Agrobacterium vitis]MBE1436725.1 hypothetical protein [Agrobacterium vitis]
MIKHIFLTFIALSVSVVTCAAMDRYYCAVDDSQLKLSIEAGFKEQSGWPLAHLRGIVVFKTEQGGGTGKTVQGVLMLDLDHIVQYWRDGRRMMIRASSRSGTGNDATDVDVLLDSKMVAGDINRFAGDYSIIVRPKGNHDPAFALTRDGKVSCSRF